MPTFYFDVIVRGQRIQDHEGSVLADLSAAHREAIKDARTLMSNAIMEGWDVSARAIEIRSENNEVLDTLSFSKAFRPED